MQILHPNYKMGFNITHKTAEKLSINGCAWKNVEVDEEMLHHSKLWDSAARKSCHISQAVSI